MSDLTIMRDNFNKLMDYYEKNDITIEDIKNKNSANEYDLALSFNKFINTTVKDSVPLFSDEVKEKFTSGIREICAIALFAGQFVMLETIASEELVNKIVEEKKDEE